MQQEIPLSQKQQLPGTRMGAPVSLSRSGEELHAFVSKMPGTTLRLCSRALVYLECNFASR